jgi:transposase
MAKAKVIFKPVRIAEGDWNILAEYSPDPIEQVFAKLKHLLRKAAAREPSTRSAPQSAAHSMPSRLTNAPTISKIQVIEPNAIML